MQTRNGSVASARHAVFGGVVGVLCLSFAPVCALGQLPTQSADARRAQAGRAELDSTLAGLEAIINSPGYSGTLRAAKRREALLIRQRLTDGDIQVGDQIILTVSNEKDYTGTFLVGTGRTLVLPSIAAIELKGVLRSEVQQHIATELARYIKNPEVRAQAAVRLNIFGAVAKPGFYQIPADLLAGDALMIAAGGPSGTADPRQITVKRGGLEIWSAAAFADALSRGLTIDQLSLRAGDEITVGSKPKGTLTVGIAALGVVSSLAFLLNRLKII